MEKTPARQLILEAVLTCIEKYGIDKVTTRKIAEEAGTNIASINYYFHTKDALVAEALSMALNHMMQDVSAMVTNPEKSFLEVFEEVLFYLLDGNLRFPGITTAHLYDAIFGKLPASPGARVLNKVFEDLAVRAIEEYPGKDKEEVRFLVSQILASAMFMMLSPNFYFSVPLLRLNDLEGCRALAKRYAKMFANALDI